MRGLNALDGSAIVDIKPYSSRTDSVPDARIGWFEERYAAYPEPGRWGGES